MKKNDWITLGVGVALLVLGFFGLNQLFEIDTWNRQTLVSVTMLAGITAPGLWLIKSFQYKDSPLFVQSFLVFTTLQLLILLFTLLLFKFSYPENLKNFALQLTAAFFYMLSLQSVILLKKNKPSE
jgi:hypothetical protein